METAAKRVCRTCANYLPTRHLCTEWGRAALPTDTCGRWKSMEAEVVSVPEERRIRVRPRIRSGGLMGATVSDDGITVGARARRALGDPKRVVIDLVPGKAIILAPGEGPGSFALARHGQIRSAALVATFREHGIVPGYYVGELRGRELWLRPA